MKTRKQTQIDEKYRKNIKITKNTVRISNMLQRIVYYCIVCEQLRVRGSSLPWTIDSFPLNDPVETSFLTKFNYRQ